MKMPIEYNKTDHTEQNELFISHLLPAIHLRTLGHSMGGNEDLRSEVTTWRNFGGSGTCRELGVHFQGSTS